MKLNLFDKAEFSNEFGPKYMGPWVSVERLTKGQTYLVKDIISGNERQVTREQVKILDIPSARIKGRETWLHVFSRLGCVEV